MIELVKGNLFESNSEAYVNTVNCVGVMGKGIALEFKKRFPLMFKDYKLKCNNNLIKVGMVDVYLNYNNPKYIINFPTKQHWKNKSELEWIKLGLLDLIKKIKIHNIKTISIPALGCNNGGLDFNIVYKYIKTCFETNENIKVLQFLP